MRRVSSFAIFLYLGLLFAPACTAEHNPSLPGDGDGDTTGDGDGDGDGGTLDASAELRITGTLCLVTDLRSPEACPSSDMSGALVTEQGTSNQTTASADGSFTLILDTTTADRAVLEVSGSGLHPSLFPVSLDAGGASGVIVPAVDATTWSSLVSALIGTEPDQSGSVALYLTENGEPAVGATVYQPDTTTYAPFYENGGSYSWIQYTTTGASGAALLFGVITADSTISIDVDNSAGTAYQTVGNIPIATDTTTFVTVDVTGG